MADYRPTIGLEAHVELKTRTKMFCDCLNDSLQKRANVNVCPICTGHPGTLPVINRQAVEAVIKVGLALDAETPAVSKFDRKNYFYPDLPKGYQISQYDMPLAVGGELETGKEEDRKKIRIRRIHLEEDTGKNIHPVGEDYSLVDFNRAGVPLMELVTEPDMHSVEEVSAFARELQLLLRYLGVSDADMEKGQMRLEANISVAKTEDRIRKSEELGIKVEVKNLNSFRALEDAVRYEIERQTGEVENGREVARETRGWDDAKKKTFSQREKEEARDYRYFPEPDLPPLFLGSSQELQRRVPSPLVEGAVVPPAVIFDIEALRLEIPELPQDKRLRFMKEYGISLKETEIFVADPALAGFFEAVISKLDEFDSLPVQAGGKPHQEEDRLALIRLAVNYLSSDLKGMLVASGASIADIRITPERFAQLMFMVHKSAISSRGAKDALRVMFETGKDPETVIREAGLVQVSAVAVLEKIALEVVKTNPKPVADYKKGKIEALQFLKGQMMAKTKGAANPQMAQEILKRIIADY